MSADRPAKGIRRTPTGWQVFVRVNGEFRSKRFPPDTDLIDLKAWRASMKARGWLKLPEPDASGETFAHDCETYLDLVKGMTTYTDRKYRIEQWRDALGGQRPRATITAVEIRHQLERWRLAGLSPASLNLRRTALMHLYSVLDGKSAKNIVRDVPYWKVTPARIVLPTLRQAMQAIAVNTRDTTSRARLDVLLWTGWPPAQLMRLKAGDVDFKRRVAHVPARRKGKGVTARTLPLLPQAVTALKRFHSLEAYGPFSVQSLRKRLHDRCRRAGVPIFNPYALRHLFLTTVALAAKDDRVVAELALHGDLRMTRRYTEQSVNPRLVEGLRRVRLAIARVATPGNSRGALKAIDGNARLRTARAVSRKVSGNR